MRVLPGDPVMAMLGPNAPKAYVEQLRVRLGLNKPLTVQYFEYLIGIFHGDLGKSMIWGERPVAEEILERFPATLELAIFSMTIGVVLGVIMGTLSASKNNTVIDYFSRFSSIFVYSLPVFWLGMILQLIFGIYLNVLPVSGRISPFISLTKVTGLYSLDSILTGNIAAFLDAFAHLILPSATLALLLAAIFNRVTRVNVLNVLHKDFIKAARLRGIPENRIVYKHALKNAFVPILTIIGLQFSTLLSGAVLTEATFSWHGLGSYIVERIYYRDFPAVQGAVVFYAIIIAGISILVDVIYAYLDPRVRF
jgi:peptide/nickel transport system permease protein